VDASDGVQIGIGIVLTLTLAAVLWYAWEARKQAKAGERMAEEMLETRHGGVLPVIDFIAEAGRGVDLIAEALRIQEGILPETLHGHLKNIGSGPALDIQFQIKLSDTEPIPKRVPRVGVGEYVQDELTRTHNWHIYLHPVGESMKRLSVEFHNVYGRPYRSWRDVSFDTAEGNTTVGPLRTQALGSRSAL
jgi:hypothetical protein